MLKTSVLFSVGKIMKTPKKKFSKSIAKMIEDKNRINEHIKKGGKLSELSDIHFINPNLSVK